jgi:hypothetical protein
MTVVARTARIWADSRGAARCRACQAPIVWAELVTSGKRMPFNAPLVALETQVDRAAHRTQELVDLGESHFATCPQADRFRRR